MTKRLYSTIVVILLFITSTEIQSQEQQSILNAPDNWQSELIPFPIGFAPSINLTGFEDLRFSPGWSDTSSSEFWTYMFVWYVEKDSALTEDKLTEYFNSYYDGLMGVDDHNQRDSTQANQLDKTICQFVKTDIGYSGEMRVYDRFFTKDYMTLNIKVTHSICQQTDKQIIYCEISPKDFNHSVWNIFKDVNLSLTCE